MLYLVKSDLGDNMAAVSNAQKIATEKYLKKTYDEIKIRVPKGQKEIIQEHAESMKESTNSFINRAISYTINFDNMDKNQGADN